MSLSLPLLSIDVYPINSVSLENLNIHNENWNVETLTEDPLLLSNLIFKKYID